MSQTKKSGFYDLDRIKQIPILDLCNRFGVEVERKGGKFWCKLRSERTASVILHPDKNTFHDFGTNKTSDNIGLVSELYTIERKDAIKMIADAFAISPENPREGLATNELTSWEYEKIGLDGKKATRNFEFNEKTQSKERITELSLRYAMPMNVLKKENPIIYEKLLKQRALPYVENIRQEYYSELVASYNLAKAVGNTEVFKRSAENGEFSGLIEELQTAETILVRACRGTHIEAAVGSYDPVADLEKILSGEIRTSLAEAGSAFANVELTDVEYTKIGLDGKVASKNFDFDLEKQDMARVSEISLRYAIPMNDLKKQNPRIYEKLLKQRALPYIKGLRKNYYLDIYNRHCQAKAAGKPEDFDRAVQRGHFDAAIEKLQTAETILERACKDTQIEAWPVGRYEPAADVEKILSGQIYLTLGNASRSEMLKLSEKENSPLKYRPVDLTGFRNSASSLEDIRHTAFLKEGSVYVGFLEKDIKKIWPIISKIRNQSKGNLSQKIASAQQKQESQRSSYQKETKSRSTNRGEER